MEVGLVRSTDNRERFLKKATSISAAEYTGIILGRMFYAKGTSMCKAEAGKHAYLGN